MAATNRFDAIVIGSGVSGGFAAKELTEKGLRVLMLDRGVYVPPSAYEAWFVSAAHDSAALDRVADALPYAARAAAEVVQ